MRARSRSLMVSSTPTRTSRAGRRTEEARKPGSRTMSSLDDPEAHAERSPVASKARATWARERARMTECYNTQRLDPRPWHGHNWSHVHDEPIPHDHAR